MAAAPTQNVVTTPDEVQLVRLNVPLADIPDRCFRIHLRLDLDARAGRAEALQRLEAGLTKRGATLENGRKVGNKNGAILWLLEQLAAGG